jgi:hypothetical protein
MGTSERKLHINKNHFRVAIKPRTATRKIKGELCSDNFTKSVPSHTPGTFAD